MGIYLNPGNENFVEIAGAKIYVDKTLMIEALQRSIRDGNKYVCISRPRRFGKTIASNMLSAYYSRGCDSEKLFSRFKIAKTLGFKDMLNKYNVIKIDLNSEYQNALDKESFLSKLSEKIKNELCEEYPDTGIGAEDSVADAILKIFAAKKAPFVIIIDEYDILAREEVSEELFKKYLSFLNGLFKSDTLRPAIHLAYLTGILPVVRDRVQSKLNNFEEYTIIDAGALDEFVGFTDDEVEKLCDEYGTDFDECKSWYDGYRLGSFDVYNPESVVKSVIRGKFGNYWSKTSTYAVIADLLEKNFDGTRDDVIKMISGENIDVNVTSFLNTMDSFRTKDDVFTYLIHVGYLAYDGKNNSCRIPNREVRQEWFNAVAVDENYKTTDKIIRASKELLKATIAGDEEAVARALDESHIHVTSNRSYNNEDALAAAIYLSYIYALNNYNCIKEMTAGCGFADVVYIPIYPDRPAIIIELKRNDRSEKAIEQIKKRRYDDALKDYEGGIVLVGIDYNEKEKTHSCRIERGGIC